MADQALTNAMARRDEIAKSINDLLQRVEDKKRELVRVDTFIKDWHEFAKAPPQPGRINPIMGLPTLSDVMAIRPAKAAAFPHLPLSSGSSSNPFFGGAAVVRNSKKEEVAAAARELISKNGSPLSRAELYRLLIARGLRIVGANPDMVLSTMLWRSQKEVVRLPKFGYWLTDKPYEPAQYTPGSDVEMDDEERDMMDAAQDGELPAVDEEMEREHAEAHRRVKDGDDS